MISGLETPQLTPELAQDKASKLDPVTLEMVKAIHWCRFGLVSPSGDEGFHEALKRGLLAHDPIWRVTGAGEAVYAAFALGTTLLAPRWRPIESVPTDQWVIVVDNRGEVMTTQVRERDKAQLVKSWEWRYWMPLPAEPTEEEHRAAEQPGGGE